MADVPAKAEAIAAPAELEGAAAAPVNPVHHVLDLCGVTMVALCNIFIDIEGLHSIDAFASLSGDSGVAEMAKRMASRTPAAGRVILDSMQIKQLQLLVCYWVKDHHKRGLDVDIDMWTEDELFTAMQRNEAEHNFEKVDADIIDPGKCQTDAGWDAWHIAFVDKLRSRSSM